MTEYKCPHCGKPMTLRHGNGALRDFWSAECRPCSHNINTLGFGNSPENAVLDAGEDYAHWMEFQIPTAQDRYENWKRENNIT